MRPAEQHATVLDIAYVIEQIGRRSSAEPSDREDNVRRRLLAIALDGLRAHDAEPLPGTPPTRDDYESRWKSPI